MKTKRSIRMTLIVLAALAAAVPALARVLAPLAQTAVEDGSQEVVALPDDIVWETNMDDPPIGSPEAIRDLDHSNRGEGARARIGRRRQGNPRTRFALGVHGRPVSPRRLRHARWRRETRSPASGFHGIGMGAAATPRNDRPIATLGNSRSASV